MQLVKLQQSTHTTAISVSNNFQNNLLHNTVSLLGPEEGYTVKYIPLYEGVPKGEGQGNS